MANLSKEKYGRFQVNPRRFFTPTQPRDLIQASIDHLKQKIINLKNDIGPKINSAKADINRVIKGPVTADEFKIIVNELMLGWPTYATRLQNILDEPRFNLYCRKSAVRNFLQERINALEEPMQRYEENLKTLLEFIRRNEPNSIIQLPSVILPPPRP